jgi:CRP-like cAMP-binding protein
VLAEPAPKVNVGSVSRYGVEYDISYWLEPEEVSPSKGQSRITTSVLAHLHSAGITPAYEKMDIFHGAMPTRLLIAAHDRKALLSRVALFRTLGESELELLASQLTVVNFHEGDTVVASGAEGETMYILVEGLLHVFAPGEGEGTELKVAQITPGQFFGEMSLLSGSPRSATVRAATDAVTFEIGRESFKGLLAQRIEIAEEIAQVIAERRSGNAAKRKAIGEISKNEENPASFTMHLLGKMRILFGLSERKNTLDGSG